MKADKPYYTQNEHLLETIDWYEKHAKAVIELSRFNFLTDAETYRIINRLSQRLERLCSTNLNSSNQLRDKYLNTQNLMIFSTAFINRMNKENKAEK